MKILIIDLSDEIVGVKTYEAIRHSRDISVDVVYHCFANKIAEYFVNNDTRLPDRADSIQLTQIEQALLEHSYDEIIIASHGFFGRDYCETYFKIYDAGVHSSNDMDAPIRLTSLQLANFFAALVSLPGLTEKIQALPPLITLAICYGARSVIRANEDHSLAGSELYVESFAYKFIRKINELRLGMFRFQAFTGAVSYGYAGARGEPAVETEESILIINPALKKKQIEFARIVQELDTGAITDRSPEEIVNAYIDLTEAITELQVSHTLKKEYGVVKYEVLPLEDDIVFQPMFGVSHDHLVAKAGSAGDADEGEHFEASSDDTIDNCTILSRR